MIEVIEGDLFDSDANVICHQVNCKGKMGSGVARQIRAKYPEAYTAYVKHYATDKSLGFVQCVDCGDGKRVMNMFAQNGYGYDGALYTDYSAFRLCLEQVARVTTPNDIIAMPYKIWCGLGGGDWDLILAMIATVLSERNVQLWKKEG